MEAIFIRLVGIAETGHARPLPSEAWAVKKLCQTGMRSKKAGKGKISVPAQWNFRTDAKNSAQTQVSLRPCGILVARKTGG